MQNKIAPKPGNCLPFWEEKETFRTLSSTTKAESRDEGTVGGDEAAAAGQLFNRPRKGRKRAIVVISMIINHHQTNHTASFRASNYQSSDVINLPSLSRRVDPSVDRQNKTKKLLIRSYTCIGADGRTDHIEQHQQNHLEGKSSC